MNSLMRLRKAIITAGSIITPTIHFANTLFIESSFADSLFFMYHGWWWKEVAKESEKHVVVECITLNNNMFLTPAFLLST